MEIVPNRGKIIETLKQNKGGQSDEAMFINYVLMINNFYRGTKTHFLFKDEEAKRIAEAVLKLSLLSVNKLLEKKKGKSLFSLLMEFSNMIKNTYVKDGILESKIEELEGGQVGGVGKEVLFMLLFMISLALLSNLLFPAPTKAAFDATKEAVGEGIKDARKFGRDYMGHEKKLLEMESAAESLTGDINDISAMGKNIRKTADMIQKRDNEGFFGRIGKALYSDEQELQELDKQREQHIDKVNTFLERITEFKDKYNAGDIRPEIREQANNNIKEILSHENANVLNIKTEEDVFDLLKRFAGVEEKRYTTKDQQMDAVFTVFNNKDMWIQQIQYPGEERMRRLCPAAEIADFGDNKKKGRGVTKCVNINYPSLPGVFRDKYTVPQIGYQEEESIFGTAYRSMFGSEKTQPELKSMEDTGENLYLLSEKTLGDVFIDMAEGIGPSDMDKALNILNDLKSTQLERLKTAIEPLDNNAFYTNINSEVVINPEKENEFQSNLRSLDRVLDPVIDNMRVLMHPDRKPSNIRNLAAHRIKKKAETDKQRGKTIDDIKEGQEINEYVDYVLTKTKGINSKKDDFNNIITNADKEVKDVVNTFSTSSTDVLTKKNKNTYKKNFIRNLIETKIPNNMVLATDNLDAAIKKANDFNDENEKISADDPDYVNPFTGERPNDPYRGKDPDGTYGGRRTTKKRRKHRTTRKKHEALRKTKYAHKKNTQKKGHGKKRGRK